MSDLKKPTKPIPGHLHDLFWEYDISELGWEHCGDFVMRRVLSHDSWDQICWLHREFGDPEIARVIIESEGRSLSPRQLRFWELVLELPAIDVDRWLQDSRRQIWDHRV